jgi:molybdopterin converting factor subunit 1
VVAQVTSSMNEITVLFFATLRQQVGSKAVKMTVPETMDVGSLKQQLSRDFPDLQPSLGTVLVAINREYAFDEAIIPPQAEVALFPPVSGG